MAELNPETTRWIESVSGTQVVAGEALVGGMSSDVHRCELSDGRLVVVRHIADRAWLEREPDLIEREATALDRLRPSLVPAPEHIASDPGRGRLLMSFLEGAMRADAEHLQRNVGVIADAAVRIAAVELASEPSLPRWTSWAPPSPTPPTWGRGALWRTAIAAYAAGVASDADRSVLLHRDFHPLNLLWAGDEIVGIVDWVNACMGHPHAELGHCRWNLAVMAGPAAADAFLTHYLALSDAGPYDHRWDLACALSFIGGPIGTAGWAAVGRTDITEAVATVATEAFVEAALDNLPTPP